MALVLLGLTATTLTVMGVKFAADARRTRAQSAEAQLGQLLTAGAVAAIGQLDRSDATTRPIEIPLPADVDAKLSVTVDKSSADRGTVVVHAEQGRRSMEQTVGFERRDGKWRPVTATLEQVPLQSGS
jgi:hypothetical protein